MTVLEAAQGYIERGLKVIPIPAREKGPVLKGWQNLRLEAEQLQFYGFAKETNIGILMGEPSGLVCVDLDNAAAIKLAPMFLPQTQMKSGRGNNPESHWFYKTSNAGPTQRHAIPAHAKADSHATVELLSTGSQVVVGPSVHPSGDLYDIPDGIPTEVNYEDLAFSVLGLHRAVLAMLGIQEEPPKQPKVKTEYRNNGQSVDLYQSLITHGAVVHGEGQTAQGARGFNVRCPREDLHTKPTKHNHCMVWEGSGGGWQAKCQHTSCGINSWQDFKTALDPNWINQEHALITVDTSAYMQNFNKQQISAEDELDEELDDLTGYDETSFPEDCLRPPGLIGKLVDYNLATAKYPQPEHALAGALSLMSLITGRRVRDENNTRTNLMIVALGPTRSGKEHARQINKRILELVGKDKLYEEKLASHSSLHGFLQQDGCGLLMNDEFGDFLALARSTKGANTQPAQIISAMIKLYSSSSGQYKADRYADNAKQIIIHQPHLVLFGTSTGEVFWQHVTPEYLSGGLFGRVMLFENRGYVDPVAFSGPRPPLPEEILQEVDGWLTCFSHYDMVWWSNPETIEIPHSDEARKRFSDHELAISNKRKSETPLRAALWSGSAEIVAKLSLLFACSRSRVDMRIELQDVDLAIRMSNWLTRRKIELSGDNVAENVTESNSKRVYRLIKSAGYPGISLSRLGSRTRFLKGRERAEILADLISNGMITQDTIPGKTKTTYVFKAKSSQRLR